MTQTPAPSEPPATRRAGRRPTHVPLTRTYGRKSKPGRNRVPASRRTGNSAFPAPQPGQNRSGAATLNGRQHPKPTGATRSSTRPASQDSLARAGPTAPPCTIRPNWAPRMQDLSQADDLAGIGRPPRQFRTPSSATHSRLPVSQAALRSARRRRDRRVPRSVHLRAYGCPAGHWMASDLTPPSSAPSRRAAPRRTCSFGNPGADRSGVSVE